MEGGAEEPQPGSRWSSLPLWIMEYAWAHRMMGIQEALDASSWLQLDSQPLSLEESCRLRVASAQVFSIVKNRDVERFHRVMDFLEASYRLQPRLVAPIKHMKVMFGLKTMVIMWMLRQGRGMVDTVFKINQFFPGRLPQYQDHCSQHEMFLMRKNHLDFKALAQTLAMNKDRLADYMKDGMEQHYGTRYAQKVEDRLLHYLQQLDALLPADTHIDTILKRKNPETEEEKLLLEVLTSDSVNITAALKDLLLCDTVSCRPCVPQASDSSPKTPLWFQAVQREEEEQEEEEEEEQEEQEQEEEEAASSPQFCSRHQRWVKSILQQCPDECSEELLEQADRSSSPPLFHSSSSTTSSQDLTPSGLVPPAQQSSQTSVLLRTAARQENPPDEPDRDGKRPSSPRDSWPRLLVAPAVQLIDKRAESAQAAIEALTCSVAPSPPALRSEVRGAQLSLQPDLKLHRLSAQECHTATEWRSSSRRVQPGDGVDSEQEEEAAFLSFDLGALYSSYSSSSDDSLHDPEYKP